MKLQTLLGLAAVSSASISWSSVQYNEDIERENAIKLTTGNQADDVIPKYFSQRLDHFNGLASQKFFKQKYYERDFTKGKEVHPIFIYIGGESPLAKSRVETGMVAMLAESYGAKLYAVEHRFYGESIPQNDLGLTNATLGVHNTNQAMGDLAHFIESKKEFPTQPVILFGCSYPGSLAAYMRNQYPHIVTGAIASSAPVVAQTEYSEYDLVVVDALDNLRPGCLEHVQWATNKMEKYLIDRPVEEAREYLRALDCTDDFPLDTEADKVSALYWLADNVAYAVQYNVRGDYVNKMCDILEGKRDAELDLDSPTTLPAMDRLYQQRTKLFSNEIGQTTGSCEAQRMTAFTAEKALADPQARKSRAWMFQCCSNYGYWQTAPTDEDLPSSRSKKIDLPFHMALCDQWFPLGEGKSWTDQEKHSNALLFGGRQSALNKLLGSTNIHFTNGFADPWKVLSILPEHLMEASVSPSTLYHRGITAHVIPGGSHCNDFSVPSNQQQREAYMEIDAAVSRYLKDSLKQEQAQRV